MSLARFFTGEGPRRDRRRVPRGADAARLKLRVLGVPFALVVVAVTIGFGALEPTLGRIHIAVPIPGDSGVVVIGLALLVAAPIQLLWLRPRLRLLRRVGRHRDRSLYHFIAFVALLMPPMLATIAGERGAARLVRVADASGIASRPDASFFVIDAPCLSRSDHRHTSSAWRASNRQGGGLHLLLDVAIPFCAPSGDPADAPAWLELAFATKLRGDAGDAERAAAWKALVERAKATLTVTDITAAAWLEELDPERRASLESAIRATGNAPRRAIRIVRAHSEPFAAWQRDPLEYAAWSVAAALAVWLATVLVAPLDARGVREVARRSPTGSCAASTRATRSA